MDMNDFDSIDSLIGLTVGSQELHNKINSNDETPLSDVYFVESVVAQIQTIDNKINEIKEYKRKKLEAIEISINTLEFRRNFCIKLILNTLNQFKQKSISFPGLANIHKKKESYKWVVKDEDETVLFLQQFPENNKALENVPKINKRNLNSFLDTYEKNNSVPECILKEKTEETVVISFLNKENKKVEDLPIPIKED
jgi:hypothetical protein